MPRHIRAQVGGKPIGGPIEFVDAVVFAGDEEGGDLEPDRRFAVQEDKRVEHGLQFREAQTVIELLRERLQVDVGRIHRLEKLRPGFVGDVAGGHRDGAEAPGAAGPGGVNGIFGKNHRIVVGKGDRPTTQALGGGGNRVRPGDFAQPVGLARLADGPILAEPAAKIASGRPERQDAGAGQKVVQRFLFDRVDAEAAAPAMRREHQPIAHAAPDKAATGLPVAELAEARTQVAFDATVGPPHPPTGRMMGRARIFDLGIQPRSSTNPGSLKQRALNRCIVIHSSGAMPALWRVIASCCSTESMPPMPGSNTPLRPSAAVTTTP